MRFLAAIALWLAITAAPLDAQDGTTAIIRFQLDNGLTVILRPADSAPRVAVLTLYEIGDWHDPPGQSGLAHLIEHVYVTAAAGEDVSVSNARQWMERYPDGWNAQTLGDATIIATVFAGDRIEAELREAAARMANLRIEQSDLEREIPRMEAELRNMYDGFPQLVGMNRARLGALPRGEGARSGGVIEQIQRLSLEQIRERFRSCYKPMNATVVVAGGFDPDKTAALIRKFYQPIDSGLEAPPLSLPGTRNPGPFEVVVMDKPGFGSWPAVTATIAYRTPPLESDLYPAFLVLVGRLTANAMPEMMRMRIERKMGSPPVQFPLLESPELIWISASSDEAVNSDEVVAKVHERIEGALIVDDDLLPGSIAGLVNQFGPILGLSRIPDSVVRINPYFAAIVLARQAQLGLDGEALRTRLEAVTVDDLNRCAVEVLAPQLGAAVVVRLRQ